MSDASRLDRSQTALLVIDVQERLVQVMPDELRERSLSRLAALIAGVKALDLPVICTEQYPQGLGSTVPEIQAELEDVTRWPKTSFSCLGDPSIARAVEETGRTQWLVAGMETHICVLQTIRDLREAGHQVHVIADACMSRNPLDYDIGIRRAGALGATLSSTETALFELLGSAGGDAFKTISRKIR